MDAPTLELRKGDAAVVGYGSLLSRASISKTLKRPYTGPFLSCRIDGWRRSWDAAMPNEAFYYEEDAARVYPQELLYLNVRPAEGTLMNAVVFVLSSDELRAMHDREWIYEPRVITNSVSGVRVVGGDAIMYVAWPRYVRRGIKNRREAAIRESYLRIVERGLAEVDPAFRIEYESTTDKMPSELVIQDTLDPEKPSPWAGRAYAP